jgi:hypothetical protein
MKLRLSYFLLLAIAPLMAADPPGFVIWPKGVPPADLTGKLDFGNHALSISHRDNNGAVEVHQKLVDVLVMQSGEATLVVGGEVIGSRTTGPGEIQGDSIKGGVSIKSGAWRRDPYSRRSASPVLCGARERDHLLSSEDSGAVSWGRRSTCP